MKSLRFSWLFLFAVLTGWAQTPAAPPPAEKLFVRKVVFTNVSSENHLLAIMEYIGHLDGVRSVKRLSLDPKTREALVEFTGSPSIENTWRAYLENMHKSVVKGASPSKDMQSKYPDWFKPTVKN